MFLIQNLEAYCLYLQDEDTVSMCLSGWRYRQYVHIRMKV